MSEVIEGVNEGVFNPPEWGDLKSWNTGQLANHARDVFGLIWERDKEKRNFYVKEILRLYDSVGKPVQSVPEDWKHGIVEPIKAPEKPLEYNRKEEEDSKLPTVELTFHKVAGFGPEVFLGVNGRRLRVKRGVRVAIPWVFYNGPLKDAIMTTYTQDPKTLDMIPQESYRPDYSFTLHRIIPPGEK